MSMGVRVLRYAPYASARPMSQLLSACSQVNKRLRPVAQSSHGSACSPPAPVQTGHSAQCSAAR